MRAIANVLADHPQVMILWDDIYEKLVYAPARFSSILTAAPELASRILLVNGPSKSTCMTGWRIGFGAGPGQLIKAMNTVQGQTTSHACSISQQAAIEALNGPQDHIEKSREAFRQRRDLMVDSLNNVPGMSVSPPDGFLRLPIGGRPARAAHSGGHYARQR